MYAGLRGDFTGHRRFLRGPRSVAVVVVTHNRADLLTRMLDGLVAQTWQPDAVIVVDNASGDHTQQVLDRDDLPLQVIRSEENVGGAGGFRIGMETAYAAGWDRIWLMDDDVVPAPDCLASADGRRRADCLMCVREDLEGRLVEKSATTFDLRNPWRSSPRRPASRRRTAPATRCRRW